MSHHGNLLNSQYSTIGNFIKLIFLIFFQEKKNKVDLFYWKNKQNMNTIKK